MTNFLDRIAERDLTVAVVGLGYVGLPLVIGFAEVGFRTVGFDVDRERVAHLNAGQSHIEDVDSSRVAGMVAAERFVASDRLEDLARADADLHRGADPLRRRQDAGPHVRAQGDGERGRRRCAPACW